MESKSLTFSQEALWSVEQFFNNTSINVITGYITINEPINFALFEKAIQILIENTDIFHMQLNYEAGKIKQFFSCSNNHAIKTITVKNAEDLEVLKNKIARTKFNILNNQLFDFTIFKLPNNTGGVIGHFHHIICDAWATSLIIDRIMLIYQNLLDKKNPTEGIIFESYKDYISRESLYVDIPKFNKSKNFWLNKFSHYFSYSYLSSNNSNSCRADRITYSIPKEMVKNLNAFCKMHSISLPLLLMSTIGIYLAKINNNNNSTLGIPILNRANFKDKNCIGAFINTVPFKMNINTEKTFLEIIQDLKKDYFETLRNEKYPYNYLLNDLRKKTNDTKNLFDVAFSYQNARNHHNSSNIKYNSGWVFNGCVSNNMDIHIYDMDNTGSLSMMFDYRKDIFTPLAVKEIYNNLINILKQLVESPNIFIKDIKLVSKSIENAIIHNYNETKTNYPNNTSIIKLIEKQANLTPNNIAVVEKDKKLTYLQLLNAINNLANYLSENGVKYQDKMCLFFNNSIELVVSILACLKLGACYIPLNTSFPIERIKYILSNSSSRAILTNSKNIDKLLNIQNSICIDYKDLDFNAPATIFDTPSKSTDLAYIIYTSGSTGNPKGVQIANQSLVNYIYWCTKQYLDEGPTNFPLYSSIAFDLTVTSVYTPLISGNAIYIYNNSNPELLIKEIVDDHNIHVLKLTPAHLTLLLDVATSDSCIKSLIVGGDILTSEICKAIIYKFHNGIKIYNEYGPTEATVGCMIYEYSLLDEYTSVPIGKPIDNAQIYILNSNMNIMPYNTIGEMYIGGDCLSIGYLNLPEANKKSFVPNPFSPGKLLYKTGDLAKIHSTGVMEYIGRADFQIKINGYRIEIGEIQAQILKHPAIKDCYVIDLNIRGNKEICAYYVENYSITPQELISTLDKTLPNYMIPKHFIKMDILPMTINGKINRKELPLPKQDEIVNKQKPENKLEAFLCQTFCELLNIKEIGTNENLFNYYLDSLTLIKAQTRLYTKGYNLDTQDFYNNKTIKELSDYILKGCIKDTKYSSDMEYLNLPISTIQKDFAFPTKIRNVFLTGATGFLGIHILYELLTKTNNNIYCLIRRKNNSKPQDRLLKKLKYYFPNLDVTNFANRITILEGNLLDEKLGLNEKSYNMLIEKIDICIHSAALVKHYGDYNLFHQTNVVSTEKLISLCLKSNAIFEYISTISVSGAGLVSTPKTNFSEDYLYIGQNYKENAYVHSKFISEEIILKNVKENGLIASIYRLGNISNRYIDGTFQENAEDNAALNRLITCINLGCYPKEFEDFNMDFSPVDICARDIIQLIKQQDKNIKVYHLYNNYYTNFKFIQSVLKKHNIILNEISNNDFKKILLSETEKYFGFTSLINDKINYNLTVSNKYTNELLLNINCQWPKITSEYIEKILTYLIKNKFIQGENNEKSKK